MASGYATRTLLKNTWYLSSSGFKYGYVFLDSTRISDVGEGEPPPEYELADLLYDFNGDAVVFHGYSLILDVVEYVFRGLQGVDLSIFTREELKKLANVGLVNSYINGVTLPIAITMHPEVVVDVARENMMRVGLVVERGTVAGNPFTVLLEVDEGKLYHGDRVIGEYSKLICTPSRVNTDCSIVDARGYGNVLTAIEEVFAHTGNPDQSLRILTSTYRVTGIDSGFVEKASTSDLLIHDVKNPLKTIPLTMQENLYQIAVRSQQPDMVFIGGDIFYDHGENLAIPVVKINELLKKKIKADLAVKTSR